MTHDELLEKITAYERSACNLAQDDSICVSLHPLAIALRAVVELHKPDIPWGLHEAIEACPIDGDVYPCLTIKAIEGQLK